ncbi:gliding motility-associated C-terminal domain-containing protein [Solitalea lacus]|uniref:T9SS type B sorting domain-containing protein n=1 Tax=Solitalea lacus TaxID=2911172 RepID=UPI001EDB3DB7|nr:gliding motility-associated C-terminal domain-containing protein [Solitalea lacus]UKJ07066.1 gliding motility-associated C-terminal domain-containing protein [Solitalea lacus]
MIKLYKTSAFYPVISVKLPGLFSLLLLLFLSSSFFSFAQTCNRSLGEPVVNITFGTADLPTSRSVLKPEDGSTGCKFQSSGLTGPNTYILSAASGKSAGHFNKWHDAPDHTLNDKNGNMLIIDQSISNIPVYELTVNGLCSGVKYEFSAWVANLLIPDGVDPNVIFNIRDVKTNIIIKTVRTGDLMETSHILWKQQTLMFEVPDGETSIKFEVELANEGRIGNDIAIDDITICPCLPDLQIILPDAVCEGEPATLHSSFTPNVFEHLIYQWQRSANTKNWQIIDAAESAELYLNNALPGFYYRVIVYGQGNINCINENVISNVVELKTKKCKTDVAITIQSEKKPVEPGDELKYTLKTINNGPITARMVNVIDDLPPDMLYMRTLVTKGEAIFNAQNRSLAWKIDSLLNNETAELELWVIVESNRTLVNKAIITYSEEDLYTANNTAVDIKYRAIPNVITPNGDGFNDFFQLPTNEQEFNRLKIFNVWGKMVYQSDNYQNNWNGSELPIGTYYYSLERRYNDRKSEQLTGYIQLLR